MFCLGAWGRAVVVKSGVGGGVNALIGYGSV